MSEYKEGKGDKQRQKKKTFKLKKKKLLTTLKCFFIKQREEKTWLQSHKDV